MTQRRVGRIVYIPPLLFILVVTALFVVGLFTPVLLIDGEVISGEVYLYKYTLTFFSVEVNDQLLDLTKNMAIVMMATSIVVTLVSATSIILPDLKKLYRDIIVGIALYTQLINTSILTALAQNMETALSNYTERREYIFNFGVLKISDLSLDYTVLGDILFSLADIKVLASLALLVTVLYYIVIND